MKQFLETDLHLTLSDEKTLITHVNDGFTFLGFHIQRVRSQGRWAVHLRPSAQAKARVKAKLKALTSREWTWLDEYTRLTTLNAIVRGWAEYYRYTSLLSDIEDITRYTWLRYLHWLLRKHKGSRPGQLMAAKYRAFNDRKRWHAEIREGGNTLEAYQWLPTRKEFPRPHYPSKGRTGHAHPYLGAAMLPEADYPAGETGPAERLYSATIGVTSPLPSRNEPLDMSERRLRAKVRDGFRCARCGSTDHLEVHHTKGTKSHALADLETLCRACHQAETRRQRQEGAT